MPKAPSITKEKLDAIAYNIGLGATYEQSARAQGISPDCLEKHLHRHPEDKEVVEIAKSKFVISALQTINSGTQGWQGRAWILERRHVGQFGRKNPEVSLKVNQQMTNTQAVGIPEEALNELQSIAQRLYGPGSNIAGSHRASTSQTEKGQMGQVPEEPSEQDHSTN